MHTTDMQSKRLLVVAALLLGLMLFAAPASAERLPLPPQKALDTTQAFYRLGDYASKLRSKPSATHAQLHRASWRVRQLKLRLDHQVSQRKLRRERAIVAESELLRKDLIEEARVTYRSKRSHAYQRYHNALKRAKELPEPRAKERRQHAKKYLHKRLGALQLKKAKQINQAFQQAKQAKHQTRQAAQRLHAEDRYIARVQKRELMYQLRALRNRS